MFHEIERNSRGAAGPSRGGFNTKHECPTACKPPLSSIAYPLAILSRAAAQTTPDPALTRLRPSSTPLLPVSAACRQEICPIICWVSTLQHALEDDVRIACAAGCTQGIFIIDPRKNDDPGFRVEAKKQSKSPTNFCAPPVPKCGTHRMALPILCAARIAGHGLENQL